MKLEDYLEEFGWSRRYLSNHLGVSKNTVSNWIVGKCPYVVLEYLRLRKKILDFGRSEDEE